MCDLHSKFEQDWTKTAVAIVDNRYFRHTDMQTDIHSNDFTFVQCHALHWADNKNNRDTDSVVHECSRRRAGSVRRDVETDRTKGPM